MGLHRGSHTLTVKDFITNNVMIYRGGMNRLHKSHDIQKCADNMIGGAFDRHSKLMG